MAMLISKFHKLIQSKVVWYIILGVIIIAFVGFFTPTMGSKSSKTKVQPVGELFGKKVMPQEYRLAYQNTFIWYALTSGRQPRMTDELALELRQEAWVRLAALRKAEGEKIMVADQEVVTQIQQMPAFQGESGVFDPRVYQAVLKYLNISSTQAETLFREQIALRKLMFRPVQAALITPYELRRAYALYTDRFVLKTALLPREQIEKGVTVSRDEAEALFAENIEAFRMPAKVRVSFVEWKVSDFIDQVEIPEGTALHVYKQNIENYRIETTNDLNVAEYKDFGDVESEITAQLTENAARRLAADAATTLVGDIAPQSETDQPDFSGATAAAGLKVKTLPAFGIDDELSGVDPTAPFRQAAFRLQDDAYSSFSDAVVGKDSVYVLSLEKILPSFLPDFEVVADKVMDAARAQAVANALSDRALELQGAVSAALAAGSSFEEAIKPYNLKIETTEEFDVTSQLDNEYADVLIPICLNRQQGELCRPVPVKEGVLIAYVAERKSTDIEVGLPGIRQELVEGLSQGRVRQLASDWQASLLREANFKNLTDK
ncbi:MAG: SurA N-terminal domain-containing protein [Verrucomicrobia bacterium]|nr:SurA N-terminal domain-containing protein [Verrucomicrobiota bacterium]